MSIETIVLIACAFIGEVLSLYIGYKVGYHDGIQKGRYQWMEMRNKIKDISNE